MADAYDSYPLLIARAPSASPTVFTTIASLEAITFPEVSSTETDASIQNKLADIYVMSSLLRRKPATFTMNFLPADATQDHLTGLYAAKLANSLDGYKFTHAASGLIWIPSGFVQAILPKSPFEGKLQADVTLRFTGPWLMNGVVCGS
jgi:hypothetical protein